MIAAQIVFQGDATRPHTGLIGQAPFCSNDRLEPMEKVLGGRPAG